MRTRKLQRSERCCGKWFSHQESKREESLRKEESRRVFFSGRHMDSLPKESRAVSVMTNEHKETCVHLLSVVLARLSWRRDHMRRPCTKKTAPAKQRGICRKTLTSLRILTKLRFMFLLKSRQCRRLLRRDQKSENVDTSWKMIQQKTRSISRPCWISSLSQTFTSGKAGHTVTGTGRKKVAKNSTRQNNFKGGVERNATKTFTIDLSVTSGSERR